MMELKPDSKPLENYMGNLVSTTTIDPNRQNKLRI